MRIITASVLAIVCAGTLAVCTIKSEVNKVNSEVDNMVDASTKIEVDTDKLIKEINELEASNKILYDKVVKRQKELEKCPEDMTPVNGMYCTNLEEICLKWGDPDNKGANGPVQCLEFKNPTRCLGKKVWMEYCIDTYPLPGKGEKPTTQMTWYDVKKVCESQGKRLCNRPEFTQACRGYLDHPYPYGDGFHRDCTACNCDREPWLDPATHKFEELDKRVPNGSLPLCKSDYGVHDMVGNNDRWVINETGKPYQSALVGGHAVKGARNRCSPSTIIHNEGFSYYETGGLCCKDVKWRYNFGPNAQ